MPWTLDAEPGQMARVYVRFRDKNGNESVGTEVGMIWYRPQEDIQLYLPYVLNGFSGRAYLPGSSLVCNIVLCAR